MKINYGPAPSAYSTEQLERNIKHARGLGLDYVQPSALGIPLAVVAGGPSINDHVEELQKFQGDVWAVNGAHRWCARHAISAAFFSCDSNPALADLARGANRAILATICDPAVFSVLDSAFVTIFDTGLIAGVHTGPTSVCSTPALGIYAGYNEVWFYGCEGSYADGVTHGYYENSDNPWRITVAYDGKTFDTEAEYHMQGLYLSPMIRAFPYIFRERSGGLLRAMVNDPEGDEPTYSTTRVIAGSQEFAKILRTA